MKKILLICIAVFTVILFSSCNFTVDSESNKPKISVRFQNLLYNNEIEFNFAHGIKLGNAKYEGTLLFGHVTDYINCSSGEKSLQFKTINGDWLTVSTRAINIPDKSAKYSLVMTGDLSGAWYYELIKDE
jgi:hypothetical protein